MKIALPERYEQDDKDTTEDGLSIERQWAMANKWTFQITPIGELVDETMAESDGLWIDPFAGESRVADVTNDFNSEQDTDYTMKARDFLATFDDGEVDGGVLVDPPYSPRQIKEHYNEAGYEPNQFETGGGWMAEIRDGVERIITDGSKTLTFGWNSTGMGKTRGFKKEKILLVCHGGMKYDTICVKERYDP